MKDEEKKAQETLQNYSSHKLNEGAGVLPMEASERRPASSVVHESDEVSSVLTPQTGEFCSRAGRQHWDHPDQSHVQSR